MNEGNPVLYKLAATIVAAETVGLEAVLDALYDLYAIGTSTRFRQDPSAVTKLIACDSALYIASTRDEVLHLRLAAMLSPQWIIGSLELHLRDHPIVAHFSAGRDARAWMLHDFIPRATFQNTMLYRTVYRPLGIEFQLAILLPSPDRAPRALVLNRRDRQFSEQDRELLALLWPHRLNLRKYELHRGSVSPPLDGLPRGGCCRAESIREGGALRRAGAHLAHAVLHGSFCSERSDAT